MEPVDEASLQRFHDNLRQYAARHGLTDEVAAGLLWVGEDFGEVADTSGLTELPSTTLLRCTYEHGQWAWRWNGRTANGSHLSVALLCDGQALAVIADLYGVTALEAVADLDYHPDRDYDGTVLAYKLVRPVGADEHCSRSGARVALAGALSSAISSDSITVPDTFPGL